MQSILILEITVTSNSIQNLQVNLYKHKHKLMHKLKTPTQT